MIGVLRRVWPGNRAGLIIAFAVVGVGVAAAAPLILSNRLLSVAISACMLALAGYGVALSYGMTGSMTVGVAVAWGGAAFTAAQLSSETELPFLAVAGLSTVVAVLVAFVVALPCVRTGGHYFVILTFAGAEVIHLWAEQSDRFSRGGLGVSTFEKMELGPLVLDSRTAIYHLALALVVVAGLGFWAFRKSRPGRKMIAIRENEELARSLGIRVTTWKLAAFALSGLPLGLAGTLYAYYLHSVTVDAFGVNQAITVVVIAVLGGARSALGPALGALLLLFIPEVLGLSPIVQQIVYGAAICLVILLLPKGIVPTILAADEAKKVARAASEPMTDVRAVASA